MHHLFICGTPLQARIAEMIIREILLPKNKCALFFYANVANKKYLYYFDRLREVCDEHHFFVANGHTAKSLLRAKKTLKKVQFETVYLASPVSAYSIIALGLGRHSEIYTFDDGTANIFAGSSYAEGTRLSLKKSIALKVLGSPYTPERIKRESVGHYTIYPQFKNNISEKLIPLTLFSPPPAPSSTLKCSVILGTAFNEAFKPERAEEVLNSLRASVNNCGHDVFFIAHPRDQKKQFNEFKVIESELMAEDEILKLLRHHSEIDLYGFCSSAQINLAQTCGVNTILIHTMETGESYSQMAQLFSKINLDFKTLAL